MLEITIPESELFDEEIEEFINIKSCKLVLEHSLVSLSKWESKWKKPFLNIKQEDRTPDEIIDYIRCMTITQNVNPIVFLTLSEENLKTITDYIGDEATGTVISSSNEGRSGKAINGEPITSELIYYWMISLQIPMECQKWHLNRLITLIRVCNIKNSPPKKTSRREKIADYKRINEARRKQMNSKG